MRRFDLGPIAMVLLFLVAAYAFSLQPPASSLLAAVDLRNPPGEIITGIMDTNAGAPANEAAARIPIFDTDGQPITVGAADQVVITDLSVSYSQTNGIAYLFHGADATVDTGEALWQYRTSTATSTLVVTMNFQTPLVWPPGEYPKHRTSTSGNSCLSVRGYVIRR